MKAPMQHRARLEETEIGDVLDLYAARAQSVEARSGDDAERVRAVAADAEQLPHVVEAQHLAVIAEDHGQAGRGAVGLGGLADERYAPPPAQPQERAPVGHQNLV